MRGGALKLKVERGTLRGADSSSRTWDRETGEGSTMPDICKRYSKDGKFICPVSPILSHCVKGRSKLLVTF